MVELWERPIPQTEEQVLAFLSSPMVKGCGKKQARKIVKNIGKEALNIIAKEKERCLLNIKGIGNKRARKIVESVISTFEVQQIFSELLLYGITTTMALRVFKEYGFNAVAIIKRNPYKLTDLDLIGFLKVDEIARRMGVMATSGHRIEACLKYILNNLCLLNGDTYVPEGELFAEAEKALNHNSNEFEKVTMKELKNSIYQLEEQHIVIEDGCVYPKYLFYHEDKLARKLSQMRGSRGGGAMPISKNRIETYQKKNGIILAEKQREAIRKLFQENLLILTGGPGTGKTTVIRSMVNIYKEIYPKDVVSLVAPTGRASRKLSEVTEHEASTIHRLIGYRQGKPPEYHHDNKLPTNLLVVDEMSMVDISLASHLLDALNNNTKILFVGDMEQLPSVSPGNVLEDMIQAGLPALILTEVFRQAQESQIINNAHRVNEGKSILIDKEKEDFFFISQDKPEMVAQMIIRSAYRFIELGYDLSDILILSPMKKGPVGTIALNEMLRERLNPAESSKKEWIVGRRLYREGDKVIQIKNNYDIEIFNGDAGIIKGFNKQKNDDGDLIEVMKVDYLGKVVSYTKGDLKEVELGYSITIHKSQGGEVPIVIIPTAMSHYNMLARNLMYTGMTRAVEKLVLVGTQKAMDIAIQNDKITKRNSKLDERIINLETRKNRFLEQG